MKSKNLLLLLSLFCLTSNECFAGKKKKSQGTTNTASDDEAKAKAVAEDDSVAEDNSATAPKEEETVAEDDSVAEDNSATAPKEEETVAVAEDDSATEEETVAKTEDEKVPRKIKTAAPLPDDQSKKTNTNNPASGKSSETKPNKTNNPASGKSSETKPNKKTLPYNFGIAASVSGSLDYKNINVGCELMGIIYPRQNKIREILVNVFLGFYVKQFYIEAMHFGMTFLDIRSNMKIGPFVMLSFKKINVFGYELSPVFKVMFVDNGEKSTNWKNYNNVYVFVGMSHHVHKNVKFSTYLVPIKNMKTEANK